MPVERQILANKVLVEVGVVEVRETGRLTPQSGPHQGALTSGIFIFQSLVLSFASLVQQDQEDQLMLTRLTKILIYKSDWQYINLKYGLEIQRRWHFSF